MVKNTFYIIIAGIFIWLIFNFNSVFNKKSEDEFIGKNIGWVSKRFCPDGDKKINYFYVSSRKFECEEINKLFTDSDLDNYILKSYYMPITDEIRTNTFSFEIDESQKDLRPLTVDNPQYFVGKTVEELCSRYQLAQFKLWIDFGAISRSSCVDVAEGRNYVKGAVIDKFYYEADEQSGDNPDEYYDNNNEKGTRMLIFDSTLPE